MDQQSNTGFPSQPPAPSDPVTEQQATTKNITSGLAFRARSVTAFEFKKLFAIHPTPLASISSRHHCHDLGQV